MVAFGKEREAIKTEKAIEITRGSDNIFADLDLPDSDDLLARANLALHIRRTIEVRGLSQVQAAQLLHIDQPKISSIVNGRLDGFSTERLMRFLTDLGCDVQITISAPHPDARRRVVFA